MHSVRPRLRARRVAVCAALAIGGCSTPAPARSPHGPRQVHELASFSLQQAGATVGRMRHLEIDDPAAAEGIRFYRVENPEGQWLGYVDSSGRVYRYRPFEVEEVFCGIYPMAEALALLFDQAPDATAIEAVPVDSEAAEAAPVRPVPVRPVPVEASSRTQREGHRSR